MEGPLPVEPAGPFGPLATVNVEHRGGVTVARIHGEIDTWNVSDVERMLTEAVLPDTRGVIVDLTGVRYLNSATIKMLFDLSERLRHRGQQMRLAVDEAAPMRAVLSLVHFERLVPLHNTIEDAEAHFGAS